MSTGTIRWVTTLVGGAVVGILAVAATSCSNDGPQTAEASSPTTPAPATAAPPATTAPTAPPTSGSGAATPDTQSDDDQPVGDDQAVGDGRTITVTGQGRTTVKPDIAHVNMGVRVTGESAQAVLAETNEKATALIAALKALGVADDDIRTSGISIHQQYGPNGPTAGYEAMNMVDLTIRDLSRAGEIIDGGAAFAGDAITLGGIWFSVADPEAVMADARADAIANARKRSAEYADAAGLTVGDIVSISESGPAFPGGPTAAMTADTAASVPLQAGTTDLTATVTVVFRMS
jgi:uncharacterized protein YggE